MKPMLKTQILGIRLTEQEEASFKQLAESLGTSHSDLLRKMIREAINQTPHLLQEELVLFKIAIRQLVGIAHNINQITKAIHSGNVPYRLNLPFLDEVKSSVLEVEQALKTYVLRTQHRWIKHHESD